MQSFYLPPGNLDVLVIRGADAVKLLQGQLTCDVAGLPDPGFTRGALCTNKGRVLATFILVRQGLDYYFVLNKGLGNVVALALKKYLPFYKCELQQLSGDSCFGICGTSDFNLPGMGDRTPAADGQCISLADGWMCLVDRSQQQYLIHMTSPQLPASVPAGSINDWLACGLQSGQFPFTLEDVEKYTPQELHLDRNGYVSFTKGCYTGQEIVARMHYRGKQKKLLFLLEAQTAEPLPDVVALLDTSRQSLSSTLKIFRQGDTVLALAHLPAEMENSEPARVKNEAGFEFRVRVF